MSRVRSPGPHESSGCSRTGLKETGAASPDPRRRRAVASQVDGVEGLGPLEGTHQQLQDTPGTLVAVDPGIEKVLRGAAQVAAGDERHVEARARHDHVRPGGVY